jgi:7-keto-8-aminopelargonate synthetase-like enzyme
MSDLAMGDVPRIPLDDPCTRGLYRSERHLERPLSAAIIVGGRGVVNPCANNYHGLAKHPALWKPPTRVCAVGVTV